MKGTLNNVFIFVAGVAIGSLVTCEVVKTKYERIAQEEIDSVKELYRDANPKGSDSTEREEQATTVEPVDEEEKNLEEYCDVLEYEEYVPRGEEGGVKPMIRKPYVISPEEFGEIDDYETTSLTYYADGVLTDENDRRIDDVELTVGKDSLNHFGEYEDDSVFVRNERLRTDYEILSDSRKYSYIVNRKPHQVEDQ